MRHEWNKSGKVDLLRRVDRPYLESLRLGAHPDSRNGILFEVASVLLAERERLRPLLERCFDHLTHADLGDHCTAVIHHGRGHQSSTACRLRGPHTVHFAVYGNYDQEARWTGDNACTGYHDDPPSESPEQERAWYAEQEARGGLRRSLVAAIRAELGKDDEPEDWPEGKS